jgi:hypothetical protein
MHRASQIPKSMCLVFIYRILSKAKKSSKSSPTLPIVRNLTSTHSVSVFEATFWPDALDSNSINHLDPLQEAMDFPLGSTMKGRWCHFGQRSFKYCAPTGYVREFSKIMSSAHTNYDKMSFRSNDLFCQCCCWFSLPLFYCSASNSSLRHLYASTY